MESDKSYRRTVLLITSIGAMMAPLDSTIVSVSLPAISHSLAMDYASIIWVPTAYLVALAALILAMGRFSDMHGRRPIFISGFAIFVLGSFLCSIATSGPELIAFRVMQGVGAAFIGSTATAIVTDTFPKEERGKALGVNTMAVYVGLSLGPPLGGFLTGALGWQSIFYINIPIGITVILLAVTKMKESKSEFRSQRFDIGGLLFFSLSLTTFLVALTLGDQLGWGSPTILVLALVAAVSLVSFLMIERRMQEKALLDLRLMTKNRLFAMGNTSALLNYAAYFGVTFMVSFYLQEVTGLSVIVTGSILLIMPATMAVLSPLSGWVSDRVGSRGLASGGMFLIAAGLLWLSNVTTTSSTAFVASGLFIIGLGMGIFSSPNTSAVMGSVERRQLGLASGTLATMRFVGQATSLAIMGAIVASVAGTGTLSALFTGIPSNVAVEGAAFVDGMRYAFGVSAIIAVAGGITSLARPPNHAHGREGPGP